MIALCSIGPILMVLLLGIFYHPTDAVYDAVNITPVHTTHDVAMQFLLAIPQYAKEVLISILPVAGVLYPVSTFLPPLPQTASVPHERGLSVHLPGPGPVS